MNPKEFHQEYKKIRHFFFSELKSIKESDLALIIELMRASLHIKNIQKLMGLIYPDGLSEEEEFLHQAENEPLQTMILNISAAQLREALKIIWKYSETGYFKAMELDFSSKDKKIVLGLIKLNDEYKEKKGFIFEALAPVRDLMFHYQVTGTKNETVQWIRKMKEMEINRKPPYQSVDLEKYDFWPGLEYERSIYSNYLFWGSEGFETGMKWQKMVWETQINILKATKAIVEGMLKNEKIPRRKLDWALQYFHGYK